MNRYQLPKPRGFTLIEIMTVAAIVGVLSSVAIPEYGRLMMRSKIPERKVLMVRIKQGVEDAFLRNVLPANANLTGAATPAAVPGTSKLMPDWTQAGWNVLFSSMSDVEGAVYYQYSFLDEEPAGLLTITATGDLDGDGTKAVKACTYQRINGTYQIDPATLPGTGCSCQGGPLQLDCEPEELGAF